MAAVEVPAVPVGAHAVQLLADPPPRRIVSFQLLVDPPPGRIVSFLQDLGEHHALFALATDFASPLGSGVNAAATPPPPPRRTVAFFDPPPAAPAAHGPSFPHEIVAAVVAAAAVNRLVVNGVGRSAGSLPASRASRRKPHGTPFFVVCRTSDVGGSANKQGR